MLNNDVSAEFETFHDNLLEYPQYTRPEEFMGKTVPEVLRSGHHANIEKWRREKSLERTLKWRPDLLEAANLSKKDKLYLKKLREEQDMLSGEQAVQRQTDLQCELDKGKKWFYNET